MGNNSEKRRAWVKNAAIIFLTFLLLLTFFSNTILNYSLPEVSAQYASYGTLTTAVKVDGTVKANESYHVIYEADRAEADSGTPQSRKVLSVFVKAGDYVQKDAPILSLKGGMSDQLEAVLNEYETLKRTYEMALLQDVVTELEDAQRLENKKKEIADEKKRLSALESEYAALVGGEDMKAVIEARLEQIEADLAAIGEQYEKVSADISDVEAKIQTAEGMIEEDIFSNLTVAEKLEAAEDEFDAAEDDYLNLKADVEFYELQLEAAKEESANMTEANALTKQLESLSDQLRGLEKQFKRAKEDYEEERGEIITEIHNIQNTYVGESLGGGDSSMSEDQLRDTVSALYDRLDALDKAYERSSEDQLESIEEIREQIEETENKLYILGMPEVDNIMDYAASQRAAEIQKLYDEASAQLTSAEARYNTAKTDVESLRKQNMAAESIVGFEDLLAGYKAELEKITAEKKELEKARDQANKELESVSAVREPEAVANEIEQSRNTIKALETDLAIVEANQSRSDAETGHERADQLKKLEELEAKIEAYKSAPETTSVTAPIAGRIVSVNYVPGDTVTSGNTVASIEIADKGYICEVTMAADEARKIQVGAPCTIVNNWWYSNIEASVTQIRPDPSSQGKNRIIVIEVKGDVSEGQSIKFSIGDKSQSYDTVLPNSAIREDNDGKFVLVVEAKNSALGTKYTAKRVDIEVIASDDTRSAVSGLYGSEFVITGSEIPVSDKQRVRLAEN